MQAWNKCPWLWKEKYLNGIEKKERGDALDYGKRIHHLLERRLLDIVPDLCDAPFEPEAQVMLARYAAQYPVEAFDVIEVERYYEVLLPRQVCRACGGQDLVEKFDLHKAMFCQDCREPNTIHTFNGKIDATVRAHDTGMLNLLEHKTEKRGGKNNLPQAWAVRPQASLYMWAAGEIY